MNAVLELLDSLASTTIPVYTSTGERSGQEAALETVASWALWPLGDVRERSDELNPGVMMFGANWGARPDVSEPYKNFHKDGHDTRFLNNMAKAELKPVRGAYLSDVFKYLPTPTSMELEALLGAPGKGHLVDDAAHAIDTELTLCEKANGGLVQVVGMGRFAYRWLSGEAPGSEPIVDALTQHEVGVVREWYHPQPGSRVTNVKWVARAVANMPNAARPVP